MIAVREEPAWHRLPPGLWTLATAGRAWELSGALRTLILSEGSIPMISLPKGPSVNTSTMGTGFQYLDFVGTQAQWSAGGECGGILGRGSSLLTWGLAPQHFCGGTEPQAFGALL